MHRLTIIKLGPIQYCNLSLKQYTILTGYQASGKSTIAKAIYFFRTIKDDIYQLAQKYLYSPVSYDKIYPDMLNNSLNLKRKFESHIRAKFLNTFGTSYSMDSTMSLSYQYTDETCIRIKLTENKDSIAPNFVWVEYSDNIRGFLNDIEAAWRKDINRQQLSELVDKQQLSELFDDSFETVYIPAGRSILTILGSQFNYLYSTMDDEQKRLLDNCTRDYLERVMRLRPQFASGLEGLLVGQPLRKKEKDLYKEALQLIQTILKGKYDVSDGEERIWVDTNHYVKMNFASSGQQEVVWIVNLLFYYLVLNKKVYFIIEEPESNLFPESQKLVSELITLVSNAGNEILLTTHSPYVLGALNNMLYAGSVGKIKADQVNCILSKSKWIDSKQFDAYFVKDGIVESCIDTELLQIDNTLLDEISHSINYDYDAIFNIESNCEEG